MHQIARFEGKNSFCMCCDFCAKSEDQEGVFLIASPNGTHICAECVSLCCDLLLQRSKSDTDEASQ